MTPDELFAALKTQAIETPSWGYGNSGTRFKTFAYPGAATTVWEKIADAGVIHKLTGIAPRVALHIPWDKVEDWGGAQGVCRSAGCRDRGDQPQYLSGRGLQARVARAPGRVGAGKSRGAYGGVLPHHGGDGLP